MEHCPDLFPQAKGKLWRETRRKRRQQRLRPGRSSGSAAYAALMQERGEEFCAGSKQGRACAAVVGESHVVSWPQSTVAW
eukprot:7820535-Lingulodinium_polyedra.AAC.1